MNQLKVALISREFSVTGGVGMYVQRLSKALVEAGHEVAVIHSDSTSTSVTGVDQFVVPEFDRFANSQDGQLRAEQVMSVLIKLRPDVVHIQGNNNFLLEDDIRHQFPSIKSLHVYDFCPTGNKFHHLSQKICQHKTGALCLPRMVYKRCTGSKRPAVLVGLYQRAMSANRNNSAYPKLIVASQFVKQQAVASGYDEGQVVVLPYFTSLPVLETNKSSDGTILFAGRIVPEKGLVELLKSLKLIAKPWTLVVAGDGPDLPRVKEMASRLRFNGQIDFRGWCRPDEHASLYRNASIVAVPSIWPEPFGIVGIEAMSHAKPVIAFDVGGISDWLVDGSTGFLVAPGDTRAMAARIEELLDNPERAKLMGLAGRRCVEQQFSANTHLEKLIGIYETVIRN